MGDGEDRAALSVRLLTLNTHKGFTYLNRRFVLHELREAIREFSADVVFLQEVLGSHELHAARHPNWPAMPQYEFLADSIWSDFAYGRNAAYPAGHHGNAILSKFPITRYDNHDISVGWLEKRGLLHGVLQLPDGRGELHVVCVHLAVWERHRRRQVQSLCRVLGEIVPPGAPLVVAGDFNDWRMRATRRLSRCAGLREAFVEAHGRHARSFPARWPIFRVDRIYFRNVQMRNPIAHSVRPWSHLSDHAALSAEALL